MRADAPRPCPYLACRHHTGVAVVDDDDPRVPNGSLRASFAPRYGAGPSPILRMDDPPEKVTAFVAELVRWMRWHETCSLEVAARGGLSVREVAKLLGMGKTHVQNIERSPSAREALAPLYRQLEVG